MVKVSITLPNNAQITFESEEPEVIHEIVGMVLRDLPRELMQGTVQVNGNGGHHAPPAAENGAPEDGNDQAAADKAASHASEPDVQSGAAKAPIAAAKPGQGSRGAASSTRGAPRRGLSPTEQEFAQFCQEANPLGDMRRVVVAAEGAARYLGAESVGPEELDRLFDLLGWQRPHSFVQTLRNAARSKFRWLERVPGRAGHYTVTDRGRATAFGS